MPSRAARRLLAVARHQRPPDRPRSRDRPAVPRNIIPTNRIDANGQALLNLFPVPNATDPGRQHNYTFQSAFEQPRNDQVLRVDWNVAPKTLFYSRLNFGYEAFKGGWGFVLNNANWPQLPIAYEIHSYGIVNTLCTRSVRRPSSK